MSVWFKHVFAAPPAAEAITALEGLLERWRANPAEPVAARARGEMVERVREQVASLLGAHPAEVILTSGGTESNNLAVKGLARAHGRSGRLIGSAVEHSSVLYPLRTLAREGFELVLLPVNGMGQVDPSDLERELKKGAALVSVQHANHEVGTLQPIDELAGLSRRYEVPFHVDAVASAGLAGIDVSELGLDLLSVSASRFGGLSGAGALWIRPGTRVLPQIEGGTEEGGMRGGGENLAGLIAMGAAAGLATGRERERWQAVAMLRDPLEAGLVERIAEMTVHGPPAPHRLPGHLHVSFPGAEGEALVVRLRQAGIEASTGSACSTEAGKPSHVLEAMGLGPEQARCSVLFSLGLSNTPRDVEWALKAVPEAVQSLREIGGYAGTAAGGRSIGILDPQ